MDYQKLEKHLLEKCKVNDDLMAVSVQDLVKKTKTTRQNIHAKINTILLKNRKWKKVGEYILIKIKK